MQLIEDSVKRSSINLTPLIDVIFILLVFFMLASSFLKWQYLDLGVSEPESIPFNSAKQSLIRVEQNEQYSLNGNPMPLEEIARSVRESLRHNPEHPVLVQPVDDLSLQALVLVLDKLKHIAGANVSLAKDDKP